MLSVGIHFRSLRHPFVRQEGTEFLLLCLPLGAVPTATVTLVSPGISPLPCTMGPDQVPILSTRHGRPRESQESK